MTAQDATVDVGASADRQTPYAAAVVIQTIGRETLLQAARSVFAQDLGQRVQLLLGLDTERASCQSLLDVLSAECPPNVDLLVMDLGYSTSRHRGGIYPNSFGGALRTILTYAANSRHVAYLDDDNWFAPNHLSSLLAAVAGKAWAFSRRQFVDLATDGLLCEDTWSSLGPDRGVFARHMNEGGFVDTSCYLIDKLACHYAIPAWADAARQGAGEDRMFFGKIRHLPFADTGLATTFYRVRLQSMPPYFLWRFQRAGVRLEQFLPPDAIPGPEILAQMAALDAEPPQNAPASDPD